MRAAALLGACFACAQAGELIKRIANATFFISVSCSLSKGHLEASRGEAGTSTPALTQATGVDPMSRADAHRTTNVSALIRDPFVRAAFEAAERDGLAPLAVLIDTPPSLDGGRLWRSTTARQSRPNGPREPR